MSYEKITPLKVKQQKPQFVNLDDEIIETYLDLASLWVDHSWGEKLYYPAVIAATCHLMTLDGLGDDAVSKGFKDGTAHFSTIRSGELTLTRFQQRAVGDNSYQSWLSQTPCGSFFLQLLTIAKAGPRIITSSTVRNSLYAKDQINGWPSAFNGGSHVNTI